MTRFGTLWRHYCRNKPAVAGLLMLAGIVVCAVAAPFINTQSPWAIVGQPYLWPGQDSRFLLGTDLLGRDILSGVLHGASVSLAIGLLAAAASTAIGIAVGCAAGYYGGWADDVLMRIAEAFQTIPALLMAVIVVALFQPSVWTIIAAISLASWANTARLMRAETMRLRHADFVSACFTFGMSDIRIMFSQILPNCLSSLIVVISVKVAMAILVESGLSFLGLGDPSLLSWGMMVANGRDALRAAWYMSAIPGLAILVTVMSINLVGEGLNDALNPQLRKRMA